jgi:thiamine-monophosphate kinase
VGEACWSEFELIDTFFKTPSPGLPDEIIAGIGDDAAVIKPEGKTPLLITNDLMIEDVHYRAAWLSPFDLAQKLVRINVSDIAAMGGKPAFGLLSIGLPSPLGENWLQDFSRGLSSALNMFGVTLIGGDTSQSPGPVITALTLMGRAVHGAFVLRHSPSPGDTVYVTGTLGDAAAGLAILESRATPPPFQRNRDETFLVTRHISPTPRVATAGEIASRKLASSMIDVSDGLIADLGHLLEKTDLGAEISLTSIPTSPAFKNSVSRFNTSPESLVLEGGEDYELLRILAGRDARRQRSIINRVIRGFDQYTRNPATLRRARRAVLLAFLVNVWQLSVQ